MRRNRAPLKKKSPPLGPPSSYYKRIWFTVPISELTSCHTFFYFEEGGGRVKNQALLGSRVWPKFATTSFPFPRNLCILFYFWRRLGFLPAHIVPPIFSKRRSRIIWGEKKGGGAAFVFRAAGRGRMVFSLYKFFAWTTQQTRKGRRRPPPLQGQEWRGTWEHGKNSHNKMSIKEHGGFFLKKVVSCVSRLRYRLLFCGEKRFGSVSMAYCLYVVQ